MKLRVALTAAPIHTLGPYNRFGLWMQGCNRRCPGCATPQAQSLTGGYEVEAGELAEQILSDPTLEGITISGGEPFLQQEGLCALLEALKKRADLGVIVYTGFSFDEIRSEPLVNYCDAIIDGEYREDLNDGGSLRGSSNQRLIMLTDRYEGLIPFGVSLRKTERIVPHTGGLVEVGIPEKRISTG